MATPESITNSRLLLVEGNDALNFFRAVARHCSLDKVDIRNFGGVSELGAYLSAIVREPGFRAHVVSLGIIRDAEVDAAAAAASVNSAVEAGRTFSASVGGSR